MELTPAEGRVLGCLMQKQVDGPDAYSLTLNELRFACNQSTGREQVAAFDDRTVEETLMSLKSKGLARFVPAVSSSSARSPGPVRCRHRAEERWRLNSPEMTVLAALLLRGPQTVEEIRALVRDHPLLETSSEVEAVLDALGGRTPTPFATRLRPTGAVREVRWVEVLTGWPEPHEQLDSPEDADNEATPSLPLLGTTPGSVPSPTSSPSPLTMVELADRLAGIERRLAGIEAALASLHQAVEEGGTRGNQPPSRVRT